MVYRIVYAISISIALRLLIQDNGQYLIACIIAGCFGGIVTGMAQSKDD